MSEFGIINLNIVPVRIKNNAKSEMISQLFFSSNLKEITAKFKFREYYWITVNFI